MRPDIDLAALAARVSYKPGYRICVSGFFFRVEFDRPDAITGEPGVGRTPWMGVDRRATEGDAVRAIFGQLQALETHECREWFRVDGLQVFSPHITLPAHLEAAQHIQGHEIGDDHD